MITRFVRFLGILGLLVHVAAAAHHAGMRGVSLPAATAAATPATERVQASGFEADFARALLIICHVQGADETGKASDGSKAPSGGQKPCPLCSLAQVAQNLPAADIRVVAIPVGVRLETAFLYADQRSEYQRKIRPPGRAPPTSLA